MKIRANGIELEVVDQGPRDGDPLLLLMGLGMQLVAWPEDLVADLVARGFRVVRMDNRDVGLSQYFDHLGEPDPVRVALGHAMRLRVRPPYTLEAMALDALGVLDALAITRAHVCGLSMGGMVAQHLAAGFPQRVKSLTLVMTSSGARHLPQPSPEVRAALLAKPSNNTQAARVVQVQRVMRLIRSPGFKPDLARQRRRIQATVQRAWHPAGTARQMVAILADGDRSRLLRSITAPTRVIHGRHDPLVPVAAAHDLVKKIPGAVGEIIDGMGHDLPEQLLPHMAAAIAENAARAR